MTVAFPVSGNMRLQPCASNNVFIAAACMQAAGEAPSGEAGDEAEEEEAEGDEVK